jgi:tRNA threonylcarbamoyladenosine biosynthesis protein TsaE
VTEPATLFDGVLAGCEATEALGATIAGMLRGGDLVLLEGPLGAGKTTLVRGLVAALGGDATEVCSPTFVLLETYDVHARNLQRVHHADLYRLRGRAGAPWEEVGLGDCLEDMTAVTAVEWPQSWSWPGGADTRVLRVRLEFDGEHRRALVNWE